MGVENSFLGKMGVAPKVKGALILSYIFDGLYYLASSDDDLRRIFEEVQEDVLAATKVQLALKKPSGEVVDGFKDGLKRAGQTLARDE